MRTQNYALETIAAPTLGIFTPDRLNRAVRLSMAALCVLVLLASVSLPLAGQTVSFAGLQTTVGSGLSEPNVVAVDGAGDVFIGDTASNRVVEVPAYCTSSSCQITVVSGLNSPEGVAVDGAGDVFISDTHNNRVLEIPAGCTSSSCQAVIGSGFSGPAGLAVDGAGDLFVADFNNSRVVELPAGCTTGSCQTIVPATGLSGPAGVAVDGLGDIFIADYYNNLVVELPAGCTSSSCQTTVGSGLSGPASVALDSAGDVFIANRVSSLVTEVPAGCTTSSCQTTVGSGLNGPLGLAVAVDQAGNVFIADTNNNRVVEVQTNSVNFGTVNIGSSDSVTLTYNINSSITLASNPLALTQGAANLDFTATSASTCVGSQSAGNTCTITINFAPSAPGLRVGAVQLLSSTGSLLATTLISGQGTGPALAYVSPPAQTQIGSGFYGPFAAVDAAGNVYVADTDNFRVVEIPAGCTSSACQLTIGSGLAGPQAIALDGVANVFIADTGNNRVVEVPAGCTTSSCIITVATGLNSPEGVAVDAFGNVFIGDTHNNRMMEVPAGCTSSSCQVVFGSGLNGPSALALDGFDNLYVTDYNNNRVVEFPAGCTSSSCQTTVASGLGGPGGVAVDAAGDLFIGEFNSSLALEIPAGCTSSSCQSTVGSGLKNPVGVAVDGMGDIFIADTYNNRVVVVPRSLAPSLTFPSTVLGSASAPQTITVQNIGNAALTFSSFAASPNFNVDAGTTTCSASSPLAAGASCNVGATCVPTATGTLSGLLTLTDNALNGSPSTQKIALSCTGGGTAPSITSASGITFVVGVANSFAVTTTGSPAPGITETGSLPAGVTFVDNGNGTGTLAGNPAVGGTFPITFTATNSVGHATQSFTLAVSNGTGVNLGSYYNVYGIATAGTSPKSGGFDNDSYAYNSSLIGTSLSYQGVAFPLAAANTLDAISSQTVAVPAGSFTSLFLLGAAVNGAQTNQSIVVTYTDGTTSTLTQNFSDWCHQQGYTGETLVISPVNRISPNGSTQTITCNLYGYTFALTSGKTAATVKLPSNRNVVFLALGLGTVPSTPIVPYIQVNGGAWQNTNTVTVSAGSSVNLGPQPLTGGSWSWTGPKGYTSTSRQINNIPLNSGVNTYVAAYTNPGGGVSTMTFTITVTGWVEIGNNINSIACASDGTLVVANDINQSVWEYVSGTWTQLPGQMRHVAIVSKSSIWGVGTNGNVYYLNGNSWSQIGSNASYIAAGSDGTVLVVSSRDGSIWKYLSPNNWTQVSGGYASVISVVKNNDYFVVNNGIVYQYNGSGWAKVGSGAAYIRASSDGTVLATTNSGQIYQYVSPNNWSQISGSMLIADPVKANVFFGMGLDYNVYSYGTH